MGSSSCCPAICPTFNYFCDMRLKLSFTHSNANLLGRRDENGALSSEHLMLVQSREMLGKKNPASFAQKTRAEKAFIKELKRTANFSNQRIQSLFK